MTRARLVTVVCLLACLAITVPMFARQGAAADAVSGTWTGDWGPSPQDRNAVSVELKLTGTTVTGTVKSTQPARADVTLSKSTYTPATGVVHLEAEAKNPRSGAAVHYIIDGKVANGAMTGTWNHETTKGDFKLTKNK